MVARRPRLEPARPGDVGREHAADGLASRPPQPRAPQIGRLEGELLAALRELGLDHRQRRAGPRRHHQLLRLVERDTPQALDGDQMRGLDRPADDPLGAVPRHLERLLLGHGPGHQLAQLTDIGRAVNVLIAH